MVDVAREAGRRAAHGVAGRQRRPDRRRRCSAERSSAAIDALGFQPDERARQLRSGRTGTIGAAVRNISDAHPVLRAIDEAARAAGLTVVAMSTEDDESREREAVMSMCRRRMDGIIIEPIAENHQYLQPEIDSGLPVVAFDRPATGVDVDTVLTDNRGGIGTAFEHLVRHGHRRIALHRRRRADLHRPRAGRRVPGLRCGAHGSPLDGLVHPGPIEPARIAAALAEPALRPGPGDRDRHRQRGHHDRGHPRAWAPTSAAPPWSASTTSRSPTCCGPV